MRPKNTLGKSELENLCDSIIDDLKKEQSEVITDLKTTNNRVGKAKGWIADTEVFELFKRQR